MKRSTLPPFSKLADPRTQHEVIKNVAALVWGLGFPTVIIAMNWRALKYTKRRGISPEQTEKNFVKGFAQKEGKEAK